MRSLMFCTVHQKYSSDQIDNEKGGEFNIYRGEERCIQGFDGET
jgi:hypothetical protein